MIFLLLLLPMNFGLSLFYQDSFVRFTLCVWLIQLVPVACTSGCIHSLCWYYVYDFHAKANAASKRPSVVRSADATVSFTLFVYWLCLILFWFALLFDSFFLQCNDYWALLPQPNRGESDVDLASCLVLNLGYNLWIPRFLVPNIVARAQQRDATK